MKVRVEQLNPVVGEIDRNTDRILEALRRAVHHQVDLLILPEMTVTGYPPQDLLESQAFRDAVFDANNRLVRESRKTALIFGTVTRSTRSTGPALFNSALVCQEGRQIGRADKTLLPVYDIFDEKRYFAENRQFACVEIKGIRFGLTICEDIWHNENETGDPVYEMDPAEKLKEDGAQALVNISASPFTRIKYQNRRRVLKQQATRLQLPLFYTNQVGGQTDILFDGDAQVIAPDGDLIAAAVPFREGWIDVDWDPSTGRLVADSVEELPQPDEMSRLFEAIRVGIRDYLDKTGVTDQVVLGLSGGIDSALVAVLAAEAIGADRVTALAMPTQFSSEGSIRDSEQLAGELGIQLVTLPIQNLFETSLETLVPVFGESPFGVAEENLQSRLRGLLLMACSNKRGALLLTTGNKSELAVGYATLYGDMNGALNPIGDLYKTDVYRLSRWLNEIYYSKEVIPNKIIEKPPSAELRPGQRDQDSLPPYEVLDDVLFRYLERQQGCEQIVKESGYEQSVVERVLRLTDQNEFKRFQAPPILKLSSKSFGTGRRWPLVQGWTRFRERNSG